MLLRFLQLLLLQQLLLRFPLSLLLLVYKLLFELQNIKQLKLIKAELRLKSLRTGKINTVKEAVNLLAGIVYNNIRKFSLIPGISHFIVGGKDSSGYHIYDLSPDGAIEEIEDFVSSGSGSVMVYGLLEAAYKKSMAIKDGIELAVNGINSAIQRDAASGNGVIVYTEQIKELKKY